MVNTEWEEMLDFMKNLVQTAGQHIVDLRNRSQITVNYKNGGELVTSADLISDNILRSAIEHRYPNHRILSEENFDNRSGPALFEGPLWIMDPLDGSVNYAKGLSHFAISVAFAVDGMVKTGVVHAPGLGMTFTAIRGKGSFCNGRKLKVSGLSNLCSAVIGTGFPHDKSMVGNVLTRINLLATRCRDIRRFAAPAIDICYVASGLLDGHTESLAPWDIAAAGLIAREAGAMIGHTRTVPDHFPIEIFGKDIIYSTPGIYKELLALLQAEGD